MTKQEPDHRKKAEEHDEQAAHQHKQTRRAMRRTNVKRDASCPPRAWPQSTGDSSWD
jgi:N-dimethylarginine dimethylaminohydrolase